MADFPSDGTLNILHSFYDENNTDKFYDFGADYDSAGVLNTDKFLKTSNERLFTTLVPKGTQISATGTDLNTITYLKVGKYFCSQTATAKTLLNCPTNSAFMMEVYSPLATTIDNETTGTWVYRLRKVIEYNTGITYYQMCNTGTTANVWTYGSWYQVPENLISIDDTTSPPTRTYQKGNSKTPIYINNTGKFETCSLATVASTGSYNDLTNKPTIPTHISAFSGDILNDQLYLTLDCQGNPPNGINLTSSTGDAGGGVTYAASGIYSHVNNMSYIDMDNSQIRDFGLHECSLVNSDGDPVCELGVNSSNFATIDNYPIVTVSSVSKGSSTQPVYINGNAQAVTCSTYAGGTKVTLNGTSKGGSTASFYAPTTAGTSGQVLKSNGSGAPTWTSLGSNAYTSTDYLPLTGGDINGSLNVFGSIAVESDIQTLDLISNTLDTADIMTNTVKFLPTNDGGSVLDIDNSGITYTDNNGMGGIVWNGEDTYLSGNVYATSDVYAGILKYAGGTEVSLNGTSKAGSTASFYAPTTAGTSGYVLKSNGSGAPTWVSASLTDTKVTTAANTSSTKSYVTTCTGATTGTLTYHTSVYVNHSTGVLMGAAWNDYAEYREQVEEIKPGYCVVSNDNGKVSLTTEKFQACDGIVSDTFGFAIGETDECKTPLAVAGRVLAYAENPEELHSGDTVCAGPNGKVVKMTREEIREWPDRIVGVVSEIPTYETWGTGNVKVDGRIWIKVK